jgi:hypothetical protein
VHVQLAARAEPPIILQGPSFEVRLQPAYAYTVDYMVYDGFLVVNGRACGSCQGAVVRDIQGNWLGSCHGGETVDSVALTVDAKSVAVVPGARYAGTRFRLEKSSRIGEVLQLTAETVFTPFSIHDRTTLTAASDGVSLSVVYAFLSSHANEFTKVLAAALPDFIPLEATTNGSGPSEVPLGPSSIIAQYSATAQTGVVTYIPPEVAAKGRSFIWDRTCDNKLYYRFLDFSNPIAKGTTWTFRVDRFPIRAPQSEWKQRSLAAPADFDHDGDCDLADFALLQRAFGRDSNCLGSSGFPCVDLDGHAPINLPDFDLFSLLLSGPK